MKSAFIIVAAVLGLSGCKHLPQATAGFEANGLIGAAAGLSGDLYAKCQLRGGPIVTLMTDRFEGGSIEKIRSARERLCSGIQSTVVDD